VRFYSELPTPRRDVPLRGTQGRPKNGEEKPVNNRFVYGSTNAPYLLARLKRDRPDLAELVQTGELSANAAFSWLA